MGGIMTEAFTGDSVCAFPGSVAGPQSEVAAKISGERILYDATPLPLSASVYK